MINSLWNGRFDGAEEIDLRLWQVVKLYEKNYTINGKGVCFIGYDTDDGIKRNKGRLGSEDGSNAIRASLQSLPIINDLEVYDYINLKNKIIEEAQKEFGEKVYNVMKSNLFPIGLGGGHDIAYASYLGIRQFYPDKKIGIVNFDTHLDMRPYDDGPTSGTSFKQILDNDSNVKYSIIGFKKQGNTQRLINTAKNYGTLILDEEECEDKINASLKEYFADVDIIYITFCMDVFNASDAPGVSAPTIMGLNPKKGKRILREIMKTGKVECLDFAEVNPKYDIDNRTAKLAATLIYDVMCNM
ncbi:formimidoylglutamase [Fusobacterium sp. PH5-44]|uniref:formimidoylglutamase n=1 Tax=unclassified Fusobacterium TaxID=2648384 RepID=UPI003D22B426